MGLADVRRVIKQPWSNQVGCFQGVVFQAFFVLGIPENDVSLKNRVVLNAVFDKIEQ